MATSDNLEMGPKEGIEYPITVQYCGNCTMPLEYCEYSSSYDKCLQWRQEHLPIEFEKLEINDPGSDPGQATGGSVKRQKRGGKALRIKKEVEVPKKISLLRTSRGKKKFTTKVIGMKTFGVDLKAAAKYFGMKYACGASSTAADEIVIQGDVKDDLYCEIPEKWPEISKDLIEDLGNRKQCT